jgi:hypothetical protein
MNEFNIEYTRYDCTIILKVNFDLSKIHKKIIDAAVQYKVLPKSENHITIIGSRIGQNILGKHYGRLADLDLKMEKVVNLLNGFDWNIDYIDDYYYVKKEYPATSMWAQKEIRSSIIQLVNIKRWNDLYHEIGKILECEILPQFCHITLYSHSSDLEYQQRGIGIYTFEEFQDLNPIKI